jgi:hypothetical protein
MDDRATAIPMVGGSRLDEPQPQKEEPKNKTMAHHPARALNPDNHTNLEAHDTPWFGAWGSNPGPGLVTPGGAPLSQCCCTSRDFVSFLANVRFSVRDRPIYGPRAGYLLRLCSHRFQRTMSWRYVEPDNCGHHSRPLVLRQHSCPQRSTFSATIADQCDACSFTPALGQESKLHFIVEDKQYGRLSLRTASSRHDNLNPKGYRHGGRAHMRVE